MNLAGIRKAVAPAILAIVAVLTSWIASGTFDEAELRVAVAGVVTAIVVYLVPNSPDPL